MNGRQRVFATLEGRQVDRRAFTAVLSLYGRRLTGCPLSEYYTNCDAYIRGQQAVVEHFSPDILFGPFAVAAEGEAWGSKAAFFENQPPNLRRPAIASPEEMLPDLTPDIDSHPRLTFVREAVRGMVAAHGNEKVIAAVVLSPIDLPIVFMGLDAWMKTVLFNDEGVKRILEVTRPFFAEWADALFADGADVLLIPEAFLNPSIVTRGIIETLTLPVLREALGQLNGPVFLHHAGGPILAHLDLFTGLPNVIGYVVDREDDLTQARSKVGPDAALAGGLDGPNLGRLSVDEIERRCRELLGNRQDDSRYILTTSGPDVALDTPPENIHAICRSAEKFGTGGSHGWE